MSLMEPSWMFNARHYLGTAEIPGPKTSAVIGKWLHRLKAWWNEDETPWCGTYVAAIMAEVDYSRPRHWYRARAWLDWGHKLDKPVPGCIVIFERKGGGHVGFVVGETKDGHLLVLGGNQGNRVSIAPFSKDRVLGYRWPISAGFPRLRSLPILASNGQPISQNEA